MFDGLFNCTGAGAHEADHTLGIRCTNIFEQLVLTAGDTGKFVHLFLQNVRKGGVVSVDGLAALEVDIRVLRRTTNHRMIRAERARPVGCNQFIIHHLGHFMTGQLVDAVDLM